MRNTSKTLLLAFMCLHIPTFPATAMAQTDAFDTQIERLNTQIAQASAENNSAAVAVSRGTATIGSRSNRPLRMKIQIS